MRGDAAPSPEIEMPAPPTSAVQKADSTQVGPMDSPETGKPVLVARSGFVDQPQEPAVERARPSVPDDTVRRLGIEPEAPEEARIQRPRFLDVNEPAKEVVPASGPGTSTIVGPSFLGLSDAPNVAAESVPLDEEEIEQKSHWRGWLAAVIILIFVALGVMQWRAQTGSGPLQAIKAKLQSLRHGNSSQPNNQQGAGDTLASDTTPKVDTQTAPSVPSTPIASDTQSATTPATNQTAQKEPATSTASPTNQTAPPPAATQDQNTTVKPQSPPTIANSQTAPPSDKTPTKAPTATAQPDSGTATPKPKRQADDTSPQSRSKQTSLGADEMAKAKDASDATAAAAWLWKATAKGNPEAPVQLADMYIKGNGVPRSCEQAVVLLKTAAEKENAVARNRLASMYATGNCVQRNRVEAYRWLSSALVANPDSQWAQQNRDIIWNQMTPDERAAAQKYR